MARSRLDELTLQVQDMIPRFRSRSPDREPDANVLKDAFRVLRDVRVAKREARDEIRKLEELESQLLDATIEPADPAVDPVALASGKLLRWVWDTVGEGDIDRWQLAAKGREYGLRSTNHLFGTQFPAMVKTAERTGRLTPDGIRRARAA